MKNLEIIEISNKMSQEIKFSKLVLELKKIS